MNTFAIACSSHGQNMEDENNRPKLENFLGVNHHQELNTNIYHHHHQDSTTTTTEAEAVAASSHTNTAGNSSMITNWLQAAPLHTHADAEEAAAPAQSLSLSMSTGTSPLPILSENKIAAVVEGQSESSGAVPRRSADTFGQRTSIYRGVTRYIYNYL